MPEPFVELSRWAVSLLSDALQSAAAIGAFESAVQWAAIVLSALAGVYEARRRELDFFGALVIAFVVSVGGGTLRDVLLSRYPLFWVTSPVYLVSVFVVAVIGIVVMAQGEHTNAAWEPLVNPVRRVMRSDQMPGWVIVVDALGLGLWAYLGAALALESKAFWLVAPVFGVITASFGGVIRDMFFAQTPTIFKRGQLYSTSAAIGSIVYVGLSALDVAATASFVICVVTTFLVRMASVRFDIVSV